MKTMKTMKNHENQPGTMTNHKNHEKPTWNHEKPWKTMKNQPGTMRNHEKPWKTMKNHEKWCKTIKKTWKIMKNQPGTIKNHEKPWKINLEPWKTMKWKPTWNHDPLNQKSYMMNTGSQPTLVQTEYRLCAHFSLQTNRHFLSLTGGSNRPLRCLDVFWWISSNKNRQKRKEKS